MTTNPANLPSKQLHKYEVKLAAPESEFSSQFVQYMANRMATAFYGKGAVSDAYPHKFDALASAIDRIEKYMETGNTEYLVDASNFVMIEFMHPRHPNAHFKGTDSNGSIGRVTNDGRVTHDGNKDVFLSKLGRILTSDDIQALADESEANYDTETMFESRP
jgi:hypothetical protein